MGDHEPHNNPAEEILQKICQLKVGNVCPVTAGVVLTTTCINARRSLSLSLALSVSRSLCLCS